MAGVLRKICHDLIFQLGPWPLLREMRTYPDAGNQALLKALYKNALWMATSEEPGKKEVEKYFGVSAHTRCVRWRCPLGAIAWLEE